MEQSKINSKILFQLFSQNYFVCLSRNLKQRGYLKWRHDTRHTDTEQNNKRQKKNDFDADCRNYAH